jgi:hypothetical protein
VVSDDSAKKLAVKMTQITAMCQRRMNQAKTREVLPGKRMKASPRIAVQGEWPAFAGLANKTFKDCRFSGNEH